jgi:hypothetical protein
MEKKVYHIAEQAKYMPPSSMGLIAIADSLGSRLLNVYTEMENLKVSYPKSASKIDAFVNSSLIPLNDKIKSLITKEIPNLERITVSKYGGDKSVYKDLGYSVRTVKDKATLDILLELKEIEKQIAGLEEKSKNVQDSVSNEHGESAITKPFIDSVQAILDKVRAGILRQAEQNIRKKKRGDVIAGTTDLKDVSGSKAAGTATPPKSTESTPKKRKNIEDISAYLAKKYKS